MICVIDASVGIKWFLDEPDCSQARDLLKEILYGRRKFLVPELFYYEVYAVCARRHPDPRRFADAGLGLLYRLPLTRLPLTETVARSGWEFVKLGLTGYDATYAAIAKTTGGRWLTYDKEAASRLGDPGLVELLG